jgi:hypothetical protein
VEKLLELTLGGLHLTNRISMTLSDAPPVWQWARLPIPRLLSTTEEMSQFKRENKSSRGTLILLSQPSRAPYTYSSSDVNFRNYANPYDESQLLQLLPAAAQAAFNSLDKQHDPLCLPDTRVDVLKQIMTWADQGDERCIFWLNGMAGTGKSTIARTVARRYNEKGRLGASFFFSRGGGGVGNADKFFASIATQLANTSKALKRYICQAIDEQRDITTKCLRDQWCQLVLRPLSMLDETFPHSSLLLVVDALGECDGDDDIRAIVQLLAEARSLRTVQLRVFITSRPETPIRRVFYQIPKAQQQDLVLHSIPSSIVDRDISLFLKHKFGNLGRPPDWPGEEALKQLVQKSGGLFIWAATACRYISEGGPFIAERLSRVLQGDAAPKTPEQRLDEIYTTVLTSSISHRYDDTEKERLYEILRATLGAIAILFSPLSVVSLAQLLRIAQDDVDDRLHDLHSILDIPQDRARSIRLHHPSFRDFLLNKDRCGHPHFYVDAKKAHEALADHCMQLMSDKLKRNMCGLDAPGTYTKKIATKEIELRLPEDLQYACQYWVQHLKRSEAQLQDDRKVHKFLLQHFLHWLEALSLIGKTSDGVHAIILLASMVRVSVDFENARNES